MLASTAWTCAIPTSPKRFFQARICPKSQASGIEFFRCDLSNVNFERAQLRNANFRQANIAGAKFTGADMGVAILRETDLSARRPIRSGFGHDAVAQGLHGHEMKSA